MKKTMILGTVAIAALATSITLSSCENKKKTAEEQVSAEMSLTDSIKNEALALFDSIQIGQEVMLNEIVVMPEKTIKLKPQFFMDLAVAEKAQTLDQKCALLGCYMVDGEFDQFAYNCANETEERNAVIAKLATDANMQSVADPKKLNELSKMDKAAFNKQKNAASLEDFKTNLENGNADKQILALNYMIMEATLNNEALFEMKNGYIDEVQIVENLTKTEKLRSQLIRMVGLLNPFYESLNSLAPTFEKMKAIEVATDDATKTAAILAYNNYIKEQRAKLETSLK